VVVTCFLLTGSASGVRAAGDDRTVRRARVPSPRTRIACRRPRRSPRRVDIRRGPGATD